MYKHTYIYLHLKILIPIIFSRISVFTQLTIANVHLILLRNESAIFMRTHDRFSYWRRSHILLCICLWRRYVLYTVGLYIRERTNININENNDNINIKRSTAWKIKFIRVADTIKNKIFICGQSFEFLFFIHTKICYF